MNSTGQHFPNMKASILTSTLLALASTLVALASANTCTDCTALVNAIRAYTTSEEDITYQQVSTVGRQSTHLCFLNWKINKSNSLDNFHLSKGNLGGSPLPISRRSSTVRGVTILFIRPLQLNWNKRAILHVHLIEYSRAVLHVQQILKKRALL